MAAGAFEVALAVGFGPAAGQSFQVITCPSETGDFGEYRGLKVGTHALFDSEPNATELRLSSLMNTADVAFEEFEPGTFPPSAVLGQNGDDQLSRHESERVAGTSSGALLIRYAAAR